PAPIRVDPFYWRPGWPSSDRGVGSASAGYAQATMAGHEILIIDGDDTLWENNVHFEQAIEDFIDFLDHSALSREQVRASLDEIERLNSRVHGYGSGAFARNLGQTYERLAERELRPDDLEHVIRRGPRILHAKLARPP